MPMPDQRMPDCICSKKQIQPGAALNSLTISRRVRDLICVHQMCILMHMRSTLNIDDEMLRKAAALTGEKEKTALVRMGLEALIARESARRLARLGGTEPHMSSIRRRRPRPAK